MFNRCDFILGQDGSMVIVLPGRLPSSPNYTVSATPSQIRIRTGQTEIAAFPYNNPEVFQRLSHFSQVGIVEFPEGDYFPDAITAMAYVETRMQ